MIKKKGFTLVELIVVVAVFSIVMVLGYNIWAYMQRSYKHQEQVAQAQSKARNAILLMVNKMKRADQGTSDTIYIKSIDPNVLRIKTPTALAPAAEVRYYQDGDKVVSKNLQNDTAAVTSVADKSTLVRDVESFTASQDPSSGKITLTIKIKDADKPIEGEYTQRSGIEN
jgi:prepilin-type N-terminal cleavage/methylation domain-containing protein